MCVLVGCGEGDRAGPHTLACLQEFWNRAGCLANGTDHPGRDGAPPVSTYDAMTVQEVLSHMSSINTLALGGDLTAMNQCWGEHCPYSDCQNINVQFKVIYAICVVFSHFNIARVH